MDTNIPEEIQEKLKIIEKEANFSHRMMPPHKRQLWFVLLGGAGLLTIALVFAIEGEYIQALFSVIIAFFFILNHFEYKNLYKLHSDACDIISYYRNKDAQ